MKKHVIGMVLGACIGSVLLASCSSGAPSSTTSTTGAPTTSTTGASGTTTSTTTGGGTTSTTAAGSTQCPTTSLSASISGSSGAAGTIETTIELTSGSATPCTLGGYPGLQMLASNGSKLPTTVVRGGSYSFTSMTPTTLTLTNKQSAYFNMGYSDVPSGSETSCPTSASLEITPPNAYDFLTIPAQLGPCSGGSITVSPVFAPSGANAQTMAPSQ